MVTELTFAALSAIAGLVALVACAVAVVYGRKARNAAEQARADSERVSAVHASWLRACELAEAADKVQKVLDIHNGRRAVTGTRIGYARRAL